MSSSVFFLDFSIFCVLILNQFNILNLTLWGGRGILEMSYLICDKRKGSPKIHIEVCKRKCKQIQECKTYKEFVENSEKKAA